MHSMIVSEYLFEISAGNQSRWQVEWLCAVHFSSSAGHSLLFALLLSQSFTSAS